MSRDICTSKLAHRFAVIGGDGRMTHLCERLAEEGHAVRVLGCGHECFSSRSGSGEIRVCTTLEKAAEAADTVVLPLPASRDGATVHCPRDPACTVSLTDVAELVCRTPHMTLFGGRLPAALWEGVQGHPTAALRVTDYYESEILQLRNAYITAEAAVMTAMEHTDRILRDASVTVLGYGRIGKYLSRLLRAMGATVTVAARREESLFEAAADGCTPLLIRTDEPMKGLSRLCNGQTVLFNTVPAPILDQSFLLALEPHTLLIDLASAPFGVMDEDVRVAAEQRGIRYLRLPSLPGNYAPRDAGRIIAECVLEALHQREGGKQS